MWQFPGRIPGMVKPARYESVADFIRLLKIKMSLVTYGILRKVMLTSVQFLVFHLLLLRNWYFLNRPLRGH